MPLKARTLLLCSIVLLCFVVSILSVGAVTVFNVDEFQAPVIVYPSKNTFLNVTVNYENATLGRTSIKNLTLTLTGGIVLGWDEASKVFSEVSDPSNYCRLDAVRSTYVALNATAYKVCWNVVFSSSYPEGWKDAVEAKAYAYVS